MTRITANINLDKLPNQSQDQDVFDRNNAEMIAQYPEMARQMNAVADEVDAKAATVDAKTTATITASQNAVAAAQTATATASAAAWVSGTNYPLNSCAISQVNFQTYRRRVAGAGTVDPSNDTANWRLLTGNGAFVPQPVTSSSIDLRQGNYFTRTVAANTTLTFDNCPPDGYSFTLELTLTAGSLALPASVRNANGLPLNLQVGKSHLLMFVTTNGGARWRMAVCPNYDN